MSQEAETLAARVAALVKDEMAAAELRGRTAGEAAGREQMRVEMIGQVRSLEERLAVLEAHQRTNGEAVEVPAEPQADAEKAFSGKRGRK